MSAINRNLPRDFLLITVITDEPHAQLLTLCDELQAKGLNWQAAHYKDGRKGMYLDHICWEDRRPKVQEGKS